MDLSMWLETVEHYPFFIQFRQNLLYCGMFSYTFSYSVWNTR